MWIRSVWYSTKTAGSPSPKTMMMTAAVGMTITITTIMTAAADMTMTIIITTKEDSYVYL